MDFDNRIVLIVGASSGIGRCVALQLANQGAIIVATARRHERLLGLKDEIEASGGQCLALAADALDSASVETVVTKTVDRFGRIDAVLLNAGGAPAIDMRKMDAAEVLHYMRSNYDVCVNYLFPILEQMKKQGHGLIATTNSMAGFVGVPLQGPYSAAKGALRLLIDTCRLEFAEYGIKFISVYPGFVATEATQGDGMPAPLEISEERAARYVVHAMHREKADYLFPASMRWIIRLARILPPPFVRMVLRQEVPVLEK